MKTLILILLAFTAHAQNGEVKHFYAGFGITALSAEIINQQIDRPFISSAIGFGLGATAGILKEVVYDRKMERGVYSNSDMGHTIWGSLVGALCIRVKFDLDYKKKWKNQH